MATLVPAILPRSKEDLIQKLDALHGRVDNVQIDIVDGTFASPASWPCVPGTEDAVLLVAHHELLPHAGSLSIEMDLMVEHPEKSVGMWVALGARRITIHVESVIDIPGLLRGLQRTYGHDKGFAPGLLSIGLAINIDSELARIEPHLPLVDYVQFMGIDSIGKQGQPFDERVLRKIALFRKKHHDIPVQVDGGVSLVTAPKLLAVGVNRLIVGSGIWKSPDIGKEIEAYNSIIDTYGRYV